MQRVLFLVPVGIFHVFGILPFACGADLSWTSVGPGGGGWIQAIACDRRNPQTLYLGCDVGGFYVSRDGGLSWRIQNEGLNNYFVECIAVHPTDSNILLLGMEGGIFKSTDQGKSWAWKRRGFPPPERYAYSAPIGALCFDPSRPEVLYAGIGRPRWGKDGKGQIYKSEDCGETWKLATREGVLDPRAVVGDLEVSSDGAYVLAATDRGLYRSDDGGKTWSASSQGLGHADVQELAISPSAPRVVYCTLGTTARDSASWNGGVWRSDDGGNTWARRSQGLARIVGKRDQPAEMTSHYKEIVVHPQDPETVYVGDRAWVSAGVYKTTDGGRNWTKVTNHAGAKENMDYGWITQWGPAVECMAISPAKPERVVFGTSGHVFLTDNAGATWQQRYCRTEGDRFRGNGLEVTCFNDIVPDPKEPGRLYLCYFDIGLLVSNDYGHTFQKAVQGMKHSGNCFTVVVDPADTNVLWAGTGQWASNQGDVCRSKDRGRTWTVVGKPETGLPAGQTKHLILDPTSAPERRILYVTSKGNGIFRSGDGGDSWRSVGAGVPEAARGEPRGLLLDPSDSKHLRLALGGSPSKGSGVYETLDGGQSWRKADRGGVLADIHDFQADPKDSKTLYVCQREYYDRSVNPPVLLPGGLFRSSDGGASWKRIYEFHFCSSVTVSPTQPDTLYVGTTDHPYHDECRAQGVVKSTDGGKTWRQEVVGLTCWNVSCIRIDRHDPSRLYVGTAGNGAFLGIDDAIKRRASLSAPALAH
jgi:photosystem II stability/assembly factor-like uncharacterized protein